MPRHATHRVMWMPEHEWYLLRSPGRDEPARERDVARWTTWLAERTSFAFHGKMGAANLLRETRQGGTEGYWYAYRRRDGRVTKRYAGRTGELTLPRLESLAAALNTTTTPPPSAPSAPSAPSTAAPADVRARAPEAVAFPTTLFAAKFQPPRPRARLVSRARLLAHLDAGQDCRLTLISAPAGFGKTTIAGQWLAERDAGGAHPMASWLTLDADDNDPMHFWRYVIAALQHLDPALGHDALAVLHTATLPPFEPVAQEALLTSLINDLIRHACRGLLVLDDYHAITLPRLHEGMTFLLDHMPPDVRLVLLTRSDPPFPLARLRAAGETCEVHVPDLVFTPDEADAFFWQTLGVMLPQDDVARLNARVEGWSAGLRMIAAALHGRGAADAPAALTAVLADAAGPRPFSQYFLSEVLDIQPESVQRFLLLTCSLGRVCGNLADAVTGGEGGDALLDQLERAGLFLEPPHDAGGWYRFHGLFADVLRHEARHRLGDAPLREAARRAGAWYVAHGMTPEAIEAALRGEDFGHAAALIEEFVGPHLFIVGEERFGGMQESATLHRWLAQMPESELYAHPALCLIYAAALLIAYNGEPWTGDGMQRIVAALDAAEAAWRSRGDTARLGEVFAFRTMLALVRGATAEAITWAQQALAWLSPDELAWRGVVVGALGIGALFDGNLAEAQRLIAEARQLSVMLGNRMYVRAHSAMLAWLAGERGELRESARGFRLVLAEARERGDHDDIGRAQVALAELLYEWNDLVAARQAAEEALEAGRRLQREEVTELAIESLARLLHAEGRTDDALQRLAAAEDALLPATMPLRARYVRLLRARRAELHMAAGDQAAVRRWLADRERGGEPLPRIQLADEDLMAARLSLAQGRSGDVLGHLHALLDEAERAGRLRFAVQVRAVLTLAYAARQQHGEARQALRAALVVAQPEGYMRTFLDAGAPMEALLRALLPAVREPAQRTYIRDILHAFASASGDGAGSVTATPDPLSPQEVRVLRLLVAGRSNPEIAGELIVSVNTVKAHVKSIYRKLDVQTRVEASATARRLALV